MSVEIPATVLKAMGITQEMAPYLPTLLQDLETLGPPLAALLDLLEGTHLARESRLLDLACGRGDHTLAAVQRFGCSALGVDGFPPFVEIANRRARDLDLSNRCRFLVDDLLNPDHDWGKADITLFLSVGLIWGDWLSTLRALRTTLAPGGCLVVEKWTSPSDTMPGDLYAAASDLGFIEEATWYMEPDDFKVDCWEQVRKIERRVRQLANQQPDLAHLFERYLSDMRTEYATYVNWSLGMWRLRLSEK
ncbi:MAG: class I SAM-dependent methyltransferase [bacterium]